MRRADARAADATLDEKASHPPAIEREGRHIPHTHEEEGLKRIKRTTEHMPMKSIEFYVFRVFRCALM